MEWIHYPEKFINDSVYFRDRWIYKIKDNTYIIYCIKDNFKNKHGFILQWYHEKSGKYRNISTKGKFVEYRDDDCIFETVDDAKKIVKYLLFI